MTVPRIEQIEGETAVAARRPIGDAMDAFNDRATGRGDPALPLALAIRDPATEEIIGGLYAVSYYEWLFVELLIVPERHRGGGVGTRLMRQAEEVARQRGCVGVWLDTFSFQARGFYERLGYAVFGEIASYPPGQSRFWLSKRLDQETRDSTA